MINIYASIKPEYELSANVYNILIGKLYRVKGKNYHVSTLILENENQELIVVEAYKFNLIKEIKNYV